MISPMLIGLMGFVLLVGLILARFPVYLSMIFVGLAGNAALAEVNSNFHFSHYLLQYKTLLWNFFSNYNLSILPLFILMGYLAEELGISEDLFKGMNLFLNKLQGGTGHSHGCLSGLFRNDLGIFASHHSYYRESGF